MITRHANVSLALLVIAFVGTTVAALALGFDRSTALVLALGAETVCFAFLLAGFLSEDYLRARSRR